MYKTNFDLTLEMINKNHPCSDENGRLLDIDLICNLLRLKYNSIEINEVAQLLIQRLDDCINKKQSWFTYH